MNPSSNIMQNLLSNAEISKKQVMMSLATSLPGGSLLGGSSVVDHPLSVLLITQSVWVYTSL